MDIVNQDGVKLQQESSSALRFDDEGEKPWCSEERRAYPDVTVHDQTDAQNAIQDRVVGPAGDESSSGEGHEAGGQKAFKGPVVGPVRLGRRREGGRVVHSALVDSCRK